MNGAVLGKPEGILGAGTLDGQKGIVPLLKRAMTLSKRDEV